MESASYNIHSQLIKKCIKGNQRAQFELYKLYYKAMYNVSYRILKDDTEAEDSMQEAFLQAFTKLETFSGQVSFGAWLKRIVVNKSIDKLNTLRKVEFSDEIPETETEIYNDENEEVSQTAEKVRDIIYSMKDKHRIILSLFYLEGFDHQEISDILNTTESNSRIQLHRAKSKLKLELERNEIR